MPPGGPASRAGAAAAFGSGLVAGPPLPPDRLPPPTSRSYPPLSAEPLSSAPLPPDTPLEPSILDTPPERANVAEEASPLGAASLGEPGSRAEFVGELGYHPPNVNPFGGPDSTTFDSSSLWAPATPAVEGSGGFLPATPLPAGELGTDGPELPVAALGAERRSPGIEEMPIGNPFDTSSADLDPGFGTGADSYRADQPGNQDYPDSGYAESSYAASDGESEHGTEYGKDEQPAGYDEAAGYAEDGAYAEDGQYDEDAVYDEDADYDEGEGAGYDEGDEGHQAPAAQEDDEFGWPEFDEPADGDAEPSGGAANSAGAPAGRDGDSRDGRRPRKAAAGY